MSEYIVDFGDAVKEYIALFGKRMAQYVMGNPIKEQIVRCCDCRHHYTAPARNELGPYELHCCDLFDYEVEPEGFCGWAKRKEGGDD